MMRLVCTCWAEPAAPQCVRNPASCAQLDLPVSSNQRLSLPLGMMWVIRQQYSRVAWRVAGCSWIVRLGGEARCMGIVWTRVDDAENWLCKQCCTRRKQKSRKPCEVVVTKHAQRCKYGEQRR